MPKQRARRKKWWKTRAAGRRRCGRTAIGTPLIWFKAPSSLLPHEGTIEIAFPEHQTHYEAELAIVIVASAITYGIGALFGTAIS